MSAGSVLERSAGYLLSGLVGIVITMLVQEWFEGQREKRATLQAYVAVFHGGHLGGHKDRLLSFVLEPDTRARLGATQGEQEYAAALIGLLDDRREVAVSLIAVTEFFRAAARCGEEHRCDEQRTLEAFGLYANDFYPIFFPYLRRMDCAMGTGDAEDSVLKFYAGQLIESQNCGLVEGL